MEVDAKKGDRAGGPSTGPLAFMHAAAVHRYMMQKNATSIGSGCELP